MNRIILGLAVANYLLVTITALLGLLSEPQSDPAVIHADAFGYHFRFGIVTALFSMLVHCIVFTYFLGTNRWVRETATAYRLEEPFWAASQRCRRRAFAAIIVSILLVVATVATGAGAHTGLWPMWLHWVVPGATYTVMVFAYRVEIAAIERHTELTDAVMVAVESLREKRSQASLCATMGNAIAQ
jgi:hypothetical protein